MHHFHPNLGNPATGRRKKVYIGMAAATLCVGLCYPLVVAGILPPTPTDIYVAGVMLVVLFLPAAAFWDNPGESRTRLEKMSEFGFLWLLISGITQTSWEIPWFVLEGALDGITAEDRWAWLWWTYGGADTRYISSNPTIAGLEFMAGFSGPVELLGWGLYRFGRTMKRKIAGCWIALIICVGLTYLTGAFFVAEWHVGWANIQQGSVGFWLKFVGLNLPWILAPAVCIPAAILELGHLYRAEGFEQRERRDQAVWLSAAE
jgi:hypothetical protein